MLVLNCPFCGPRDESEFAHGGVVKEPRPENTAELGDAAWIDYLTVPPNPMGRSGRNGGMFAAAAAGSTSSATPSPMRSREAAVTNSTQTYRLDSGGLINRDRPVNFRFNGKTYSGFAGDTLASALLASGVRLTARSFKYHRPRGIIGAGCEEPATLVELVGDEQSGNQPITTVRLRDGLEARSVNCWPSPGFDLMAVNQLFARFIPAAFYYQDLHVARLASLRAPYPPCCRARLRSGRLPSSGPLRDPSRPLRRPGRWRRTCRPDGGTDRRAARC